MNKTTLFSIAVVTAMFFSNGAVATTGDTSSTVLKSSKTDVIAKGTINVLAATYGGNCTKKNVRGNVTGHIKAKCNGLKTCNYKVELVNTGDPFPGCPKTYVAEYNCGGKDLKAEHAAEASAQTEPLVLSCEASAKDSPKSDETDTKTE